MTELYRSIVGLAGFKPEPADWRVRRCPVHELVSADYEYCPILLSDDFEACGARLGQELVVERTCSIFAQ